MRQSNSQVVTGPSKSRHGRLGRIVARGASSTWVPFAGLALAALAVWWISVHQTGGMIYKGRAVWLDYAQRFWPLGALLILALLACCPLSRSLPLSLWSFPVVPAARRFPWFGAICALAASLALVLIAVWSLRAYPSSSDEFDYLFQAQTFFRGHLWNPVPAAGDWVAFDYLFQKDGKWVVQYSPGWPGLLAAAHAIGMAYWMVNSAFGVALLVALYRLACVEADRLVAAVTVGSVAVSSFFIFNAASYFTHVAMAFFLILFCLAVRRFLARVDIWDALATGASLGMIGLIRPYDAVIVGLAAVPIVALRARSRHYALSPVIIAGGLPFLFTLLWYQHAITGHALTPVIIWGDPNYQLGLHPVDGVLAYTPMMEVRLAFVRLVELAEWTSPVLLAAIPVAATWLWRARWLEVGDVLFPAFVVAYLFVAGLGWNQYGPRFYFEPYPLLVLTCAKAALGFARRYGAGDWRGQVALGAATAHIVICVAALPAIGWMLRRAVDQRMDVYDTVVRDRLTNAVVIVRDGTGVINVAPAHDLVRNNFDFSGPVIYVHDLPGRRKELKALFPGRRLFVYERAPNAPLGSLHQAD